MPSSTCKQPAADAYRVRDGEDVVYLMPFENDGRRVVYEQDLETFETTRGTVSSLRARRLADRGREVELYETPAWADPTVPHSAAGGPSSEEEEDRDRPGRSSHSYCERTRSRGRRGLGPVNPRGPPVG